MRLRSVELELADVPPAAEFLERLWGLVPAGSLGRRRASSAAPAIIRTSCRSTKAAAPARRGGHVFGVRRRTRRGKAAQRLSPPDQVRRARGRRRLRAARPGGADLSLHRRDQRSRAVEGRGQADPAHARGDQLAGRRGVGALRGREARLQGLRPHRRTCASCAATASTTRSRMPSRSSPRSTTSPSRCATSTR